MAEPILYVDKSEVLDGAFETVKRLAADLVAFVDANEPRLLAYDFFFDEGGATMTCVALHPDSASMELHMDVGWERFRAFTEHIRLESIDVYGDPSENVVTRLRRKIQMLGRGAVRIHRREAGFSRAATRRPEES